MITQKKALPSSFYILIIAGLIIRLIFATLPAFKIDMDAWFAWALRVNDVGFWGFYSDNIWTNYTPGYIYILWFLGFLKNLFHLPDWLFIFLLKLPSIFAEIFLGYLVYKIMRKNFSNSYSSIVAAVAVLFNPGLIFNSAIWGQIDGFLTLLLMLSIYFLEEKKYMRSSVFFGLALLIKPQALFILPAMIFYLLPKLNFKILWQITIPAVLTALILSIPFFITDPVLGLPKLIIKMSNDYAATSLFAFNFWGIFGFWVDDKTKLILTYQFWGYLMLALYLITLFILNLKKKLNIYLLSGLVLMGFYFLPTRVHDRYLYPAIPFLFVGLSFIKSKVVNFLVWISGFIYLLNLYYVYIYYNELFLKLPKVLYIENIYNLLDKYSENLSLMATLIFLTIFYLSFRSKQLKNEPS